MWAIFSERELCCLSVVCNVRAPYSAFWNYWQHYLAVHWHPWKILWRSSRGNPSVEGRINTRVDSQI